MGCRLVAAFSNLCIIEWEFCNIIPFSAESWYQCRRTLARGHYSMFYARNSMKQNPWEAHNPSASVEITLPWRSWSFSHKTPSSVGWIQSTSLKILFHFTIINKLDKHHFRPICFLPLFSETNVFCLGFLENALHAKSPSQLMKIWHSLDKNLTWILGYFFVALQPY